MKELANILQDLRRSPLLLLALAIQVFGLFISLTNLPKEFSKGFLLTLLLPEVPVISCIIAHVYLLNKGARALTRLIEAGKLPEEAYRRGKKLTGHILVFNIDLNTFDLSDKKNYKLWSSFCSDNGIRSIDIALSPARLIVLENMLANNEKTREVFLNGDAKINIYACQIESEWKEVGFAVFMPENEKSEKDRNVFLFIKAPPFSTRSKDEEKMGQDSWRYRMFLDSKLPDAVRECIFIFNKSIAPKGSCNPFKISELIKFRETPPKEDELFSVHGEHFRTEFAKWGSKSKDPTIKSSKTIEGKIEMHLACAQRDLRVIIDKNGKPNARTLLWVPPFAYPKWDIITAAMDEHLRKEFNIIHLQHGKSGKDYTFTGAEADVDTITTLIESNSNEFGVASSGLTIIGVSAGAYVAAAVAARHRRVKALCLILPVMDLLDSVDRVHKQRGVTLLTRRVSLGQAGFRCKELEQDPGSLTYFESKMRSYHLLDIARRGYSECSRSFFRRNLATIIDEHGTEVAFAHNELDSLVPLQSVRSEADPWGEHCSVFEIPWYHDVQRTVRYNTGLGQKDGQDKSFKPLMNWLLKPYRERGD